ncbi:MAG: hypothetical protein ACLFQX_01780 [Candidatus Kapaibacterium sp.]
MKFDQNKSIKSIPAFLAMVLLALLLNIGSALACEIDFKVIQNKKDTYSPGDVLIAKVTVIFTHRNCPEGIDATKFDSKGIEIAGATNWTEVSTGTWERKLKLKIKDDAKSKASVTGVRTCDKEGGFGTLNLKVK